MKKELSSRKHVIRYPLSCLFAALLLSVSSLAMADYQDPLDTPAQAMGSAPQSLLLDITQTGMRLVAVGERGHILYSNDHGVSWLQASVPISTQLNAVYFVDSQKGWAVGEDAVILHTEDGGVSWNKQFDGRGAELKGPLLDLYFRNADEGFAVGVFNKLYRTTDGGEHWEEWQGHADNPDEWHFFAMTASSGDTIYITSEVGLLFRSRDGGETFVPVQTAHDGSFHGVLAQQGRDGLDRLILSGVGGKLLTSVDGGESWTMLDVRTEAGLSGGIWLNDGSALVVGADGIVLHISADLSSVKKSQQANGLPLSSIVRTAQDRYILVGLGGIQSFSSLQTP